MSLNGHDRPLAKCLKYPVSGHSRQRSDVAMAVDDPRRHQGDEAVDQLQGGEEQRAAAARPGFAVLVEQAFGIEFAPPVGANGGRVQ